MRIKLVISYDGTNYLGWQSQKGGNTIQQEIEKAIFSLTSESVNVTASGRTDSGVHALGQVAHFDTNSTIPPEKFSFALNTVLPDDIKILSSSLVSDTFNARYSAKIKTYEYSLYVSNVVEPLKDRYSTRIYPMPNIDRLIECGKMIEGEHDFKGFSTTGSSVKTTVRTVSEIKVSVDKSDIKISVTGNGFLYNMVRIIVGTMLKYACGDIQKSDIERAFLTGDRKLLGKTLPSKGLTLKSVVYDAE